MGTDPMRDPRLSEAMEVCRPGHDDLADLGLAFLADRLASDPELDRQFRRLKRLDQSLADAFQDVPVPDRILARLGSAKSECPPATARPSQAVSGAAASGQRVSRRWLLVGAGSFAAALAMLLFVGIEVGRPKPIEGSDLGQAAIEFFASDVADGGQPVEEVAPPESHPYSADLQQFPGTRWRRVRGFLGQQAIAYDIPGPRGERGTLYVVHAAATDVPARPPRQPFVTQGSAASAWQADQCLYVLVVEGGARAYERLLISPREELAANRRPDSKRPADSAESV